MLGGTGIRHRAGAFVGSLPMEGKGSSRSPQAHAPERRRALAARASLLVIGAAGALFASRGSPPATGDRRAAIAAHLTAKGLRTEAEDVVFLDAPAGAAGWGLTSSAFLRARVVVRAQASESDPRDIYLVQAKLSPAGALLDVSHPRNLSETIGADETRPVVLGQRVAFASLSGVEGAPSVVNVLDFAGQGATDWPLLERAQRAVQNWQATGQLRGVAKKAYVVDGKGEVGVRIEDGHLVVDSDGRTASLLAVDAALPSWIVAEPEQIARPGNLVTWSVDRVRAEIGDENMQAVKQAAFTVKDFFERNKEELTGDTGAESIAADLGQEDGIVVHEIPTDPDLGWPPPPLVPWVEPPLEGEGQWNAKDDPAFFRNQPGLPPVFLTTFIRSDRTRKATRVYVALWDPRRVELHMMAGTVEPKGATGKAGPGLIPRTPDVMKRLVAATNAGFQALHGEYGMMADGIVYLPPKPYGATVAKTRDGSTAFGTWPQDATVPDLVVSYRQNMTVMVQDEKFNPYERTWWGGTVPGAEDKTHTVRTGICLTREKFVAYFYGADLSPEALAQAMIQTRCSYGIALDMNAGHSGMEFYNVAPEAELPPVSRALSTKWEDEGDVPDLPGWKFRAKTLINGMGLMNFPRYIKRESRDFFFLTLRHVLPGPALPSVVSPPQEGEGVFRTKGLPQQGFPYALAVTDVRPDASDPQTAFRVLAFDPRTLAVGPANDTRKPVAFVAPPKEGAGKSLWLSSHAFVIDEASPGKTAALLAVGSPELDRGAGVLCVHEESGMLYYAEVADAAQGKRAALKPMAQLFEKIGCHTTLGLAEPMGLVLGDGNDLTGKPATVARSSVRLVRDAAPGGTRFFEDTPVVPRSTWYPLQQHRVRYFKKQE